VAIKRIAIILYLESRSTYVNAKVIVKIMGDSNMFHRRAWCYRWDYCKTVKVCSHMQAFYSQKRLWSHIPAWLDTWPDTLSTVASLLGQVCVSVPNLHGHTYGSTPSGQV
jgi:hypothetical protein